MKTKSMNKKTIFSSLIAAVLFVSVSSAFAAWDSSSESSSCYGQPCRDWHNNGYTHSQYPNGVNFATFNGYKDAKKTRANGTVAEFQEMQFTYIEPNPSSIVDAYGNFLTTPWESSNYYNFAQGTNYTINFNNNNQPVKIGFWGYIHNNGVADQYPAYNSQIKFENWASSTPKTIYNPGFRLWTDNTKPKTIWSNVTLRGNKAFTLTPKRAYVDREDGTLQFNAENLTSVLNQGIRIKSNGNNAAGRIDSSHLHYVLVYIEFEAVPQVEQPKLCRNLRIIKPDEANDGRGGIFNSPTVEIDENGFINETMQIQVDADAGAVSDYAYFSSDGKVTFDGNVGNAPDGYRTTKTSLKLNGKPRDGSYVWVWAMQNANDNYYWGECADRFVIKVKNETEEPVCTDLTTSPGSGQTVTLTPNQPVTVNVTSLTDSDGGAYYDPSPVYEYCFSGSIYWNNSQNTYVNSPNAGCVRTLQNYMQNVLPYNNGTMTIKVVGSETVCNDNFTITKTSVGGDCLNLNIYPTTFNGSRSNYSTTVNLNPANTPYIVQWRVLRNGQNVIPSNVYGNTIELDNYNYSFVPGDTLTAQALIDGVADPDCYVELTSEEDDCEYFRLNRENFVRDNQRICFRTDWPFFDEVEYETDTGRDGTLDVVNDNCFILTRNITENAESIDIWVPGYKGICEDNLRYEERPPVFDKFVRAEGDSVFRTAKTVATFMDDNLEYRIEYMHYNPGVQDVIITDTIGEGPIQGYVAREGDDLGGTITYDNNMRITVGGENIDECDEEGVDSDEDLCYEGEIGNRAGVRFYNLPDNERVVITYRAELESKITPESCSDPASIFNVTGICGEQYKNTARFEDDTTSGNDNTELWIPCPFIIIRAGGDVVFENPLDYGVDTLYCADIANADVPIIIPEDEQPGTPSTGEASAMPQYSGDICKNKDAPGYKDLTSTISSLICEVSFKTTQDLTQKAIVQSINTNKEKISRFEKNLNNWSPTISGDSAGQLPETRNNVYYKNTGDLTFANGTLPVEFASGARTFIVEDNDVYIKSNITYADSDPDNLASIAIIVINGNLIVDENVTETSGVLFVQEGARAGSGQVCAGPSCESPAYTAKQLIHYGSIYGDIENLFKYRVFAGDPSREEGALVIRFDNRIYINTPPVLNELVQISQEITS